MKGSKTGLTLSMKTSLHNLKKAIRKPSQIPQTPQQECKSKIWQRKNTRITRTRQTQANTAGVHQFGMYKLNYLQLNPILQNLHNANTSSSKIKILKPNKFKKSYRSVLKLQHYWCPNLVVL